MLKISITDLRTGETPYITESDSLESAKAWILYMLPGLGNRIDDIAPNTRMEVDRVYELAIRTDESLSLPIVQDRKSPAIPNLDPLDAAEAIAMVQKQTDPQILALMADGERTHDNRKTVLTAIAQQIEKVKVK